MISIDNFISGVTASITNQVLKHTITPVTVGSAFTDLATIVGTVGNNSFAGWAYSGAYALTSITRDANDAIVSGNVVWPDGSTGVFVTDTASTLFPGAIDAYHMTYVPSTGSTRTITQSLLTRDSAGAVTAQPALIFS